MRKRRFLLLLWPARRRQEVTPSELGRRTGAYVEWVARLRSGGLLQTGASLCGRRARIERETRREARRKVRRKVRVRGGEGPPSGYFVIEVADWDAALRIAASCPGADPGRVELFELDPFAEVGPTRVATR